MPFKIVRNDITKMNTEAILSETIKMRSRDCSAFPYFVLFFARRGVYIRITSEIINITTYAISEQPQIPL